MKAHFSLTSTQPHLNLNLNLDVNLNSTSASNQLSPQYQAQLNLNPNLNLIWLWHDTKPNLVEIIFAAAEHFFSWIIPQLTESCGINRQLIYSLAELVLSQPDKNHNPDDKTTKNVGR